MYKLKQETIVEGKMWQQKPQRRQWIISHKTKIDHKMSSQQKVTATETGRSYDGVAKLIPES